MGLIKDWRRTALSSSPVFFYSQRLNGEGPLCGVKDLHKGLIQSERYPYAREMMCIRVRLERKGTLMQEKPAT